MIFLFQLIKQFELIGIVISLMIENMGVPLPTEGAYLLSQNYIVHGRYSFWAMYWLMVAAQMLGSILAYAAGHYFDAWLLKRFNSSAKFQHAHTRIHDWYAKYGSVTVLGTKLIGYVRPFSSIVAGVAEYPFWPFVWWSLVGTMIIVYLTMKATGILVLVWQRFPGGPVIVSVAVLAGFLAFLWFFRKSSQSKT